MSEHTVSSRTRSSSRPRAIETPRRLLLDPPKHIMTRADCETLFKRVVALTTGGGDTQVSIRGTWAANLRWARNRPTVGGDTTACTVQIIRTQTNKLVMAELDQLDDVALEKVVQTLEHRLATITPDPENPQLPLLGAQTYLPSAAWDDATFSLTAKDLSDTARRSVDPVVDAHLDAAGYVEVSAAAWAIFNTRGLAAYAVATGTQYSETVRNVEGTASGWTGKSHMAWSKLDVPSLSAAALQKCQDSANPVKVEPGRYTTILEPKAVALLMHNAVQVMDRNDAERKLGPYHLSSGKSKIGLQIMDDRISVTSDPTDPECSYMPFDPEGAPYGKITWVDKGVLRVLPYDRNYARKKLDQDLGIPNPMAFRVSGGTASIAEMISTTERGIYVTHFGSVDTQRRENLMSTGMTRDGTWLIEQGKLVHPIENFWFNDDVLVIFNQVEQLGVPVRTQGVKTAAWGGAERDLPTEAVNDGFVPIVAPPMKIRDFNFTRLSEAI